MFKRVSNGRLCLNTLRCGTFECLKHIFPHEIFWKSKSGFFVISSNDLHFDSIPFNEQCSLRFRCNSVQLRGILRIFVYLSFLFNFNRFFISSSPFISVHFTRLSLIFSHSLSFSLNLLPLFSTSSYPALPLWSFSCAFWTF